MKYILAVDQGTTGSRAIVYNRSGKIITSAYREFPQYFPQPGWVEHDPEEIWKSVFYSIDAVLRKVNPKNIAAIGITNQRETTVIWNRKTGRPVYNAIVWQCRRTAQRCFELKKDEKIFKAKTGLPIDAYFSATKIEWILKKKAQAKNQELLFGTTDTWILWKLTGGKVHATDYSNASRTMLFNIDNLEWDQDLLKLFKINPAILPEVKPSSGIFGKTLKLGRLPEGIPISGIAGDQQAALFGQSCFEPGSIKNTYGTGCFMLLNSGGKRPQSKHGLITTLGCGGVDKPIYALEGSVFIAGAAIQWLRDKLQIIQSASESEKLAKSLINNEGVYFVPALVGLGAPHWNAEARGTIVGLTRGSGREHLVRAALEAMCYSSREIIKAMERDSGLKVKSLKIDGGASKNNFLCQFQADLLGIPVVRPKVVETTSLGAAYLSGLGIGFYKNLSEIKNILTEDRAFYPKMPKAEALKYYQGWEKAVRACLM